MKAYFLSICLVAIALSWISILSSNGGKSGLSGHLRFLSSLLLLCLLFSPLKDLIPRLKELAQGELVPPGLENPPEDSYQNEWQESLDEASRDYFAQTLTRTLEERFSIATGQVRCKVFWNDDGSAPLRVTVVLSGAAIWKNPAEIEAFVEELLGCPCQTAIE